MGSGSRTETCQRLTGDRCHSTNPVSYACEVTRNWVVQTMTPEGGASEDNSSRQGETLAVFVGRIAIDRVDVLLWGAMANFR
jgi:hypothetical protein